MLVMVNLIICLTQKMPVYPNIAEKALKRKPNVAVGTTVGCKTFRSSPICLILSPHELYEIIRLRENDYE